MLLIKKVVRKIQISGRDLYNWWYFVVKVKKKYNVPLYKRLYMYFNGFRSDDYINYHLQYNNLKEYISEFERCKTRRINGKYNLILDDKLIFYEIFKNYINIPKNLGFIKTGDLYTTQGYKINIEDISDFFKGNETIIIKPIDGAGGKNVYKVKNNNGKVYIDETISSITKLKELIKKQDNSIVCSFIIQHKYSSNIFPKSTNTIRVITIKDTTTNKYIIPCAVHRFGNNESIPVDNACRGGFISNIDIDTGKLGVAKSLISTEVHEIHPDTQSSIKGVTIYNWDIVKTKLVDVASKFPYLYFIAWDVVITDAGFEIIEANASTDINLFQIWNGMRGSKLGEFYKFHKVLK